MSGGPRDTRPLNTTLPREAVQNLLTHDLMTEGDDATFARWEADRSAQLSILLRTDLDLLASFSERMGTASANKRRMALVIDTEPMEVRSVAWELLSDHPEAPPLELRRALTVLRLGKGQPMERRENAGFWNTVVWQANPEDENSLWVKESMVQLCEAHGFRAPTSVGKRATDGPTLLVVTAHGTETHLLLNDQPLGADVAVSGLATILSKVELVVLAVCRGGTAVEVERRGLVGQLLDAGAPAVIASMDDVDVNVFHAFMEGVYEALAGEADVSEVVASGRRHVRELASPFSDARWHRFTCTLGSLEAAAVRWPGQPMWRPAGWPAVGWEVAELLARARKVATDSGFLGVEHLLLALPETAPGRYRAARQRVLERLGALQSSRATEIQVTPRLIALGAVVPEGCQLPELWDLLEVYAPETLRVLVGYSMPTGLTTPGGETRNPQEEKQRTEPATGLELVTGPEDGRILSLVPGDVIGRWSAKSTAAHMLYATSQVEDSYLSRTHLKWMGEGRVALLRPCVELPRGEAVIERGRLLALTQLTWVRAI